MRLVGACSGRNVKRVQTVLDQSKPIFMINRMKWINLLQGGQEFSKLTKDAIATSR